MSLLHFSFFLPLEHPNLAGKSSLSEFVCDANEALQFRLIRGTADDKEEDDDKWSFNPEMSHQVYGESEKIFGYRNLNIECLFCAGSLKAFIKHSADEEAPAADGIKADPLVPPLLEVLAEDQVATNETAFHAAVKKDGAFKPMGEKLTEWTVEGSGSTFECYHNTNEKKELRDYLARAQPFIMFFIDAASYIDIEDDRWQVFLLFEK